MDSKRENVTQNPEQPDVTESVLETLACQSAQKKFSDARPNYLSAQDILCRPDGLIMVSAKGFGRNEFEVELLKQTTLNCFVGLINVSSGLKDSRSAHDYYDQLLEYTRRFKLKADITSPLKMARDILKGLEHHH